MTWSRRYVITYVGICMRYPSGTRKFNTSMMSSQRTRQCVAGRNASLPHQHRNGPSAQGPPALPWNLIQRIRGLPTLHCLVSCGGTNRYFISGKPEREGAITNNIIALLLPFAEHLDPHGPQSFQLFPKFLSGASGPHNCPISESIKTLEAARSLQPLLDGDAD